MPTWDPNKTKGLTLIELLVVMALVAIVMAMGVSSMASVAVDSQAAESINTLISSLRTARSEAILSYEDPVIVCPSDDGASCNSTDWSDGWLVFVDENGNGANDGNDRLIRVEDAQSDVVTVRGLDTPNNRLIFDSEGMLVRTSAFVVCDNRGDTQARAVVINVSGQTRIATDDSGDGIVDTHLGSVNCNA